MPDAKHGHFYWNEMMTKDVDAATDFYRDVMGWTFEGMDMGPSGTYWVAKDGDQPLGGVMAMPAEIPAEVPPHWMSYIAVDDVDARIAKAVAAGATVMREPFDVPGVGRIAILTDGGGAAIGWITPEQSA